MFYNKTLKENARSHWNPNILTTCYAEARTYIHFSTRGLEKCLLFQVCIIQNGPGKARCIYTLRSLTTKRLWPNLVSPSLGFRCQVCWIGGRYDTRFSSINSMPAGLSQLVKYVRLADLLFCWHRRSLNLFTYKTNTLNSVNIVPLFATFVRLLSYAFIPYLFSVMHLISRADDAPKYWICQ